MQKTPAFLAFLACLAGLRALAASRHVPGPPCALAFRGP